MQSLERRIAALEQEANKGVASLIVRYIYPEPGQSSKDAIRAAGYDPDEAGVTHICFVALARDD